MSSEKSGENDRATYDPSVMMSYIFRLLYIKTTSVRDDERSKLKERQKAMEEALKSLYDEKYQEIKQVVDVFGHISRKIEESSEKTKILKEKLLLCKSVLSVNFTQYRARWTKIHEISESVTLLNQISEIISAPAQVDKLMKEGEYKEAIKTLMGSYVRLKSDFSSFTFLRENEILLSQKRLKIFAFLMEKVLNLLFKSSPECSHQDLLENSQFDPSNFTSEVLSQEYIKQIKDFVEFLTILDMIPQSLRHLFKECQMQFKNVLYELLHNTLDSLVETGRIRRHENASQAYLPDVFHSLVKKVGNSFLIIMIKHCVLCNEIDKKIHEKSETTDEVSSETKIEVEPSELFKLVGTCSIVMIKNLIKTYLKEIVLNENSPRYHTKTFCSNKGFQNIFSQKNHTIQKHQATLFQFHPNSHYVTESVDFGDEPFHPAEESQSSTTGSPDRSFTDSKILVCCPDIRYYPEILLTVTAFIELQKKVCHLYSDSPEYTDVCRDFSDYIEIYYTEFFYPYICQNAKTLLRTYTCFESNDVLNISDSHPYGDSLVLIEPIITIGKLSADINAYILSMPKYSSHLVSFYTTQLERVLSSSFRAAFQNTKLNDSDENCASLSIAINFNEDLRYTPPTPFDLISCKHSPNELSCDYPTCDENLMTKTDFSANHDCIYLKNLSDLRSIIHVCESWCWFSCQLVSYIKFLKLYFVNEKNDGTMKSVTLPSDIHLKILLFGSDMSIRKLVKPALLYYTKMQCAIDETIDHLSSAYNEVEMYSAFFIRFLYLDLRIRVFSTIRRYFIEELNVNCPESNIQTTNLHSIVKILIRDLVGIHDMFSRSLSTKNNQYVLSNFGRSISQTWIKAVRFLDAYNPHQIDQIIFHINAMQRSLTGKLSCLSEDFSDALNFYRLFSLPFDEILEYASNHNIHSVFIPDYERLVRLSVANDTSEAVINERIQKMRTILNMKTCRKTS